ncbi:MAG: hypothetical protein HYY96_08480 [Candidatus Tectomicrobia bacterium]|nr:hypothetical protein [Candidatus Tectomicrobia bacterium]
MNGFEFQQCLEANGLTVGAVARAFGITAKAVRLWKRNGVPVHRLEELHRLFQSPVPPAFTASRLGEPYSEQLQRHPVATPAGNGCRTVYVGELPEDLVGATQEFLKYLVDLLEERSAAYNSDGVAIGDHFLLGCTSLLQYVNEGCKRLQSMLGRLAHVTPGGQEYLDLLVAVQDKAGDTANYAAMLGAAASSMLDGAATPGGIGG